MKTTEPINFKFSIGVYYDWDKNWLDFQIYRKKINPLVAKNLSKFSKCCPDDKVKTTQPICLSFYIEVYYDYGKNWLDFQSYQKKINPLVAKNL